MHSIFLSPKERLEKDRLEKRKKVYEKYKVLKIPKGNYTNLTGFCPKCGYETYENPDYCIKCGSKFNKDEEYFKDAINEIRFVAEYNGKRIPKSITEDDILKLKDDEFFKNECCSFILTIFYIFTRKLFEKDEAVKIVKNLRRMSEINQFLVLCHFYECTMVFSELIDGKLENWEGFEYLLNYDKQEITDFEFVSQSCLKFIRYLHIQSRVRTRHPNYNLIKSYWDKHAENDLSLVGYMLGTIELVDGVKKAYDIDVKGKKVLPFDEEDKWNYRDRKLCLKLKAMWKMLCLNTSGDYYKVLWYELVEKCQLDPNDEMHLIFASQYEHRW